MTMPLQLRLSVDSGSVAMGEHVRFDQGAIRVDAGTPLGVMMHRNAIRDVRGPSAC